MSPFPAVLGLALLLVLQLVVPTVSLICYENNGEDGIVEVYNASWSYCTFVPPSGNERSGRAFGLSQLSDSTHNYDGAFARNDALYSIRTMCILERYNFRRVKINNIQRPVPEFLFRCMCNFDRCNSAVTFRVFLKAMTGSI